MTHHANNFSQSLIRVLTGGSKKLIADLALRNYVGKERPNSPDEA